MRKKQAQREKQIKDKVINQGGWRKDIEKKLDSYESQQFGLNSRSQESFVKPAFKKYDIAKGTRPTPKKSNINNKNSARRSNEAARRSMRRSDQ